MPRARDPNRSEAFKIYKDHDGKIDLVVIARQLNISPGTVRGWKSKDKWDEALNGTLQKDTERSKRKRGGQPGNKNAVGHGALEKNKNAKKHGLFEKYLPEETMDIINNMPLNPLDILWDNIKIAYAAIVRAQQITYVQNKNDKTTELIEEGDNFEKWDIQQAWDKQGKFMQSQARAQSELRSMIKQYDELLHKNWDMATEEQRSRIDNLRARTDKITGNNQEIEDLSEIEGEIYGTND